MIDDAVRRSDRVKLVIKFMCKHARSAPDGMGDCEDEMWVRANQDMWQASRDYIDGKLTASDFLSYVARVHEMADNLNAAYRLELESRRDV